MRKMLLLLVAFAMLSLSTVKAQVVQANIYASELKVSAVSVDNEVEFTYTLNADAQSVTIEVSNGDVFAITDPADMTKGVHTVTMTLDASTADGEYTWTVTASSEPNETLEKVSGDDINYRFYYAKGLVVDKSFESPYFGRVYVAESHGSRDEGEDEDYWGENRFTDSGIYAFDPLLNAVNTEAYTGGIPWITSSFAVTQSAGSPWKLSVDDAGKVYIADVSNANSGVYVMDPADPTNFTSVFDDSGRDANGIVSGIHGRVTGIYVEGSGDNTVLYTVDRNYAPAGYTGSFMVLKYDIGELTAPYVGSPIVIYDNAGSRVANEHLTLLPDGRDGWWIYQNRWEDTNAIPSLVHINASGVRDYVSFEQSLFAGFSNNASYRGAMDLNREGNIMAVGSDRKVKLFSVEYNSSTGIPSLTLIDESAVIGTNIDGLAFDVAENLYVYSASTECFYQYTTPKADNTFTTPAPASQPVVVDNGTGLNAPLFAGKINVYCEGNQIKVVSGNAIQSVKLYSVQGQTLVSKQVPSTNECVIPAPAAKGIYLIETVTATGRDMRKIVIK